MLTIRRMLPGEERVYNTAHSYKNGESGAVIVNDTDGKWLLSVLGDGQTIVEAVRPCSVRFKDGGHAVLVGALEEIANDTDNVRHARVVARRALREGE